MIMQRGNLPVFLDINYKQCESNRATVYDSGSLDADEMNA